MDRAVDAVDAVDAVEFVVEKLLLAGGESGGVGGKF